MTNADKAELFLDKAMRSGDMLTLTVMVGTAAVHALLAIADAIDHASPCPSPCDTVRDIGAVVSAGTSCTHR